jgi:transposase-like protein
VTSDGAPGLLNAIQAVFSGSVRIRCWYHKMANIRAKLPQEGAEEFMAHVRAIRDAPTPQAGEAMAAAVIERFSGTYPAAVACLADDLEASLAHLRVPPRHRINVRTTNLIERSFEEERRRSKVIPRFGDEKAAMKLVFAVLIRVSERWNRVRVTPTWSASSSGSSGASSAWIPLLRPPAWHRSSGRGGEGQRERIPGHAGSFHPIAELLVCGAPGRCQVVSDK